MEFLFHQRNDDKTAAEGEGVKEKGGGEQRPVEFEIAFHAEPPSEKSMPVL